MRSVPNCYANSWQLVLLMICVASLTQAQLFPGHIEYFPSDHYVLKGAGQNFTTTCIVTLNMSIKVNVLFLWQSSSGVTEINNTTDTTVTQYKIDGNQVIGRLTIHNAVFSNAMELMCLVNGLKNNGYVSESWTSIVHPSIVPFAITSFPGEELKLSSNDPFTLRCIVTVDEQFPLGAVSVLLQYFAISIDNTPSEEYISREINEGKRTLTVSVHVQNVRRRNGGFFKCTASTKAYENAAIPQYSVYNSTRISMASLQSPQDSSNDRSINDSFLALIFVFSVITITLLVLFTILVIAVVWTKKHRSRNYPISPFHGTIPTATAATKSNYYSDSPESSAVNKITIQPEVALHITPRLQSFSSAETDV